MSGLRFRVWEGSGLRVRFRGWKGLGLRGLGFRGFRV